MPWVFLLLAGLLEIVWAAAMKQSGGFTRPLPVIVMAVTMPASFALLALAMRSLPLSTSYIVWTGIGAAGAFVIGTVWLGEAATLLRCLAAAMILGGIILMRMAEG